jgi:hypothetical protein
MGLMLVSCGKSNTLTTQAAEATIKSVWDSQGGIAWEGVGDFDGKKPVQFVRFNGLILKSDYEAEETFISNWDCDVVTTFNDSLRCFTTTWNCTKVYACASRSDITANGGVTNTAFFNKTPEGWKLTKIYYKIWDDTDTSREYNMPIDQ